MMDDGSLQSSPLSSLPSTLGTPPEFEGFTESPESVRATEEGNLADDSFGASGRLADDTPFKDDVVERPVPHHNGDRGTMMKPTSSHEEITASDIQLPDLKDELPQHATVKTEDSKLQAITSTRRRRRAD